MKIKITGKIRYFQDYGEERRCFTIEHKGKKLRYMPPNNLYDKNLFKLYIRQCLIRTLMSQSHESVWA
jgi:hypothetical protein